MMPSRNQKFILFVPLAALIVSQIFLAEKFGITSGGKKEQRLGRNHHHDEHEDKDDHWEEIEIYRESPPWSAFARQHHQNLTEFDASIQWRLPGMDGWVSTRRSSVEVLTYGIAGVIPWYGTILPAIRFDAPFNETTQVQMANVDGIVDATLDLHHCTRGRNEDNNPDGYFDACFPPKAAGRDAEKEFCYQRGKTRDDQYRVRDYPAPGHERWSCTDPTIMEQLAAAQVLDYIIGHGDRFYDGSAKNIFFFWDQRPPRFVSIDHHSGMRDVFTKEGYGDWAQSQALLKSNIPSQLRKELARVVLRGSRAEFVQKLNATIFGQLDNLERELVKLYKEECGKQGKSLTKRIWIRLEDLVSFYNITSDD